MSTQPHQHAADTTNPSHHPQPVRHPTALSALAALALAQANEPLAAGVRLCRQHGLSAHDLASMSAHDLLAMLLAAPVGQPQQREQSGEESCPPW